MNPTDLDHQLMHRALTLAAAGRGLVEPNPMVGCVVAHGDQVVAEGWHRQFGDLHAEAMAIELAGERCRGATLYATLEPCSHHGKRPPCADAIIAAGIRRVVMTHDDPFPAVQGAGRQRLEQAGIEVVSGVCEAEARELNAPFLKLVNRGQPWVLAKWAMSLDGKIATATGDSQWISGEESRAVVHDLRGRMDAIVVGRGTALADNPRLTARPKGARIATRIVLDSHARLPLDSQLVQSAAEAPVMVVARRPTETASDEQQLAARFDRLREAGCEVFLTERATPAERWVELLDELGRRRFTNVLVEGGGQVFGSAFDARVVDEVHVFVAPRIIGGAEAASPVAGHGAMQLAQALSLRGVQSRLLGEDFYLAGRAMHAPT